MSEKDRVILTPGACFDHDLENYYIEVELPRGYFHYFVSSFLFSLSCGCMHAHTGAQTEEAQRAAATLIAEKIISSFKKRLRSEAIMCCSWAVGRRSGNSNSYPGCPYRNVQHQIW